MTFEEAKAILRNPDGWPLTESDIVAIEYLIARVEGSVEESIELLKIKTPIQKLRLSIRSENGLLNGNILYIEDITEDAIHALLKLRGIGRKSINEIRDRLQDWNADICD